MILNFMVSFFLIIFGQISFPHKLLECQNGFRKGEGIKLISTEQIEALLFADLVILAENEDDLQKSVRVQFGENCSGL